MPWARFEYAYGVRARCEKTFVFHNDIMTEGGRMASLLAADNVLPLDRSACFGSKSHS